MKLVPLDRWADTGSGFNRTAADVVYKAMTGMDDDTALVFGRLMVAGMINYDLISHRDELAKAAGDQAKDRAEKLRDRFSREAVAKARRGLDNTTEITALVQISKAFDYTLQERQRFAAGRTRHEGRFVQEHRKIDFDEGRPQMATDHAKHVGIPDSDQIPEGKDRAAYQQAFNQIQDLLVPFNSADLKPLLHLHILNATTGEEKTAQVPVETDPKKPTLISSKLSAGDRIESASVSVTPTPGVNTAAFDALAAAGAPRLGGYAAQGFEENAVFSTKRLAQYNQDRRNPSENEQFSGTARTFGRLDRGSKILLDSFGDTAPPKLKYALAVANHVGQYGPEAQKVLGPVADRAAYRYRGTERALDPKLRGAFDLLHHAGYQGADAREVAIRGIEGKKGEGWEPGSVLRYFRKRLPDPDLNELQRRSGVIPPSEGIIIAANGSVAHQSVGFADDWYLPFNLRHLSALKGGEYIRTRSFGGPTTEDIYTGLVSGAKSMTVVSHNGVYTVDFDQNLRGGRRFNDKAGRMVGRYGQLLDAVRSEQVSRGGISQSRMAELREEAAEYAGDDASPAFKTRLTELQNTERRKPTLSQREQFEAADEWLAETASDLIEGRPMTSKQLTDQLIDTRAKMLYEAGKKDAAAAGVPPVYTLKDYQQDVRSKVEQGTPVEQVTAVAELMGQKSQLERALVRAADLNADRVKTLRLDGTGYDAALKALQEQFPYYIADVRFKPWKEARGIGGVVDRTREGATDTGYVAPRFNRPEEAEAGYFNSRVGQGKVEASSIRYQNFRNTGGKLRPVGTAAAAGGTTATTGSPAAPKQQVSDAELQRAADLAMLDEVLAKTTFDGGKIGTAPMGGFDIRQEVEDKTFPASHAAIKRVFTADPLELRSLPHNELHDLMMELTKYTTGPEKILALNEATVQRVRTGKVQQAAAAPSSLSEMLRSVGRDHEFPSAAAAYDPLKISTVKAVEDTYSREPTIRDLVDAGELPPVNVDDKTFDDAAKALRMRLDQADSGHSRRVLMGRGIDVPAMRTDLRAAEGLLRATQLRRRWKEADENKPAPPAAPPGPNVTNAYTVIGTPNVLAALQNQLQNPP